MKNRLSTIADFQKTMTCSQPFEMVENVGCVHLYIEFQHTYDKGYRYCQSLGAELYEFVDFDNQYQDVFNYLKANGGKSLFLRVILCHSILLPPVSRADYQKDQAWIGLRRAKNGNYYWPMSGNQVEHRERKNIWYIGQPDGDADCAVLDLYDANHVKNSLRDFRCSSDLPDVSFCQIPFV